MNGNFNLIAHYRLKTILISDDVNLRNICLSSHIPSVATTSLWKMICNPHYSRLDPGRWVDVIQDIEGRRLKFQQQQQQNHP